MLHLDLSRNACRGLQSLRLHLSLKGKSGPGPHFGVLWSPSPCPRQQARSPGHVKQWLSLSLHGAFSAMPPHVCRANSVKSAHILTQLSLVNKERRNFRVSVSWEHLHPFCSSSLTGVCMGKTLPKIPALRYPYWRLHFTIRFQTSIAVLAWKLPVSVQQLHEYGSAP